MRRFGPRLERFGAWLLAAALAAPFLALPASAQDSSTVSITNEQTTTTTSTSSEFITDWRLWALVGAVLLVIIIIAATRRGDGDRTTVVK